MKEKGTKFLKFLLIGFLLLLSKTLLATTTYDDNLCAKNLIRIINFDSYDEVLSKNIETPIRKIFLETSIFHNYFDDQNRKNYQDYTINLFSEIEAGKYIPYTSEYVIVELNRTPEHIRIPRVALIEKYRINVLPTSGAIEDLANAYINGGIMPRSKPFDAIHVATATINKIGVLISLDHSHIVRNKTRSGINKINRMLSLRSLILRDPADMIDALLHQTFKEYMNNLKIENIPIAIRRSYALKKLVEDETKNMQIDEKEAFLKQRIYPIMRRYNIKLDDKYREK